MVRRCRLGTLADLTTGDALDEVADCWAVKEHIGDAFLAADPDTVLACPEDALDPCEHRHARLNSLAPFAAGTPRSVPLRTAAPPTRESKISDDEAAGSVSSPTTDTAPSSQQDYNHARVDPSDELEPAVSAQTLRAT